MKDKTKVLIKKVLKGLWKDLIINIPALVCMFVWFVLLLKLLDLLDIIMGFEEPFKIIGLMVWIILLLKIPSIGNIIFYEFKKISFVR